MNLPRNVSVSRVEARRESPILVSIFAELALYFIGKIFRLSLIFDLLTILADAQSIEVMCADRKQTNVNQVRFLSFNSFQKSH